MTISVGTAEDVNVVVLFGGQKQRGAISCVLSMESEALVFDKPTCVLDLQLVSDLLKRGWIPVSI